jgi:adenosylcobinamide-GDP ribazoletransferase
MPFLIAIQFLTRLPLRLKRVPSTAELGASTAYFPLAGLLGGVLILGLRQLAAMDKVGSHFLPLNLLVLCFWVWFCDSLHLDGLADTFDGLASYKSGKAMLKVMHLGNTGAFGSLALVLDVLAKFVFLISFPPRLNWLLPLPFLFSRLFLSWGCSLRPYAGRKGSLSSRFIENTTPAHFGGACFLAACALAGILAPAWYLGLAPALSLGLSVAVCFASLFLGRLVLEIPLRRLGGISGDLLGFGQQVTELAAAYGLLFLMVK